MSEGWYFQVNEQVIGPFDSQQLKQQADVRIVKLNTLVRKGESGKWVEAWHVNGLFVASPMPKINSEEEDLEEAYAEAAGLLEAPMLEIPSTVDYSLDATHCVQSVPLPEIRQEWQSAMITPCPFCGEEILVGAKKCKHCGEFLNKANSRIAIKSKESDKRILPLFLFFFFLGFLGVHAFYAGRTWAGVPYLLVSLAMLFGGLASSQEFAGVCFLICCISLMVDFIRIILGAYKDGEGRDITEWT